MPNLSNKKGTIAHYLNKNMSKLNSYLTLPLNKAKEQTLNLLNEGLRTGEITDKEEVEKVIPCIQSAKQNRFYSLIGTLLTGLPVGNAQNGYGRIKSNN